MDKEVSKVPRNLDGVFYRVERNGRWCAVCFSDMTADERKATIYDRMDEMPLEEQVGYYKRLAELMADQLYDMGEQLGVVCE